jgi:hypothetical protein
MFGGLQGWPEAHQVLKSTLFFLVFANDSPTATIGGSDGQSSKPSRSLVRQVFAKLCAMRIDLRDLFLENFLAGLSQGLAKGLRRRSNDSQQT